MIKRNKKKNEKYNINRDKIIELIRLAKVEIDIARENFNYLDDPKLIEMAIYQEQAAKSKFEYLVLEAKRKGIKAEDEKIYLDYCK
ncbi:DUF2508 family protein [Clostridium fallax]|uniref:DUF2508 domain-containing protein n=1 Tax=Clostridium fallax TaxID=1533 RepID=A0A1M4W4K2_9CLOT|nr:DUF2508 family protein [Clostridium fallax]SHE76149.1 Protein of unknown function [Clostridium fallax]SQB22877.1 Protein of uncharacterised function (DUF2508) [Clostridium fallax]